MAMYFIRETAAEAAEEIRTRPQREKQEHLPRMKQKVAIIIGAGPAGLTAAHELLKKTDIKPIVYEMSPDIGGLSKTVVYKGNRMDIGGHRFFSKSHKIMEWWQNILPMQKKRAVDDAQLNRKSPLSRTSIDAEGESDKVMLIRTRRSRIFFLRFFFDYPITLKWKTFRRLGLFRIIKISWTYLLITIPPARAETNLEDFLINRFGKELYLTFFKDYTEKVWGVPCREIPADWGSQRIKGLSVSKTLLHALRSLIAGDTSIEQRNIETSLIGRFLYPKLGPGQLWEEAAHKVVEMGGEIHLEHEVTGITIGSGRILSVTLCRRSTGTMQTIPCDYLLSSMPVKEFIAASTPEKVPDEVGRIAQGLEYRALITVGLLLKKLRLINDTEIETPTGIVPDNWIYIQDSNVRIGRIQLFNNWSPYLVKDPDTIWLGLEYFCREGDDLWRQEDEQFIRFAIAELEKIEIICGKDVLDATILRVPKAYPAYFGAYGRFAEIRSFTDSLKNLFLVGRNGMHRYNNTDLSMLTAMAAVENIQSGSTSKNNIWDVT